MSNQTQGSTIPAWGLWRRPPMHCPKCMAPLPDERLPRRGLERFAVRCGGCSAVVRFVRENMLPPGRQLRYPEIWVPMLLADRRSRTLDRVLWEPCESGWQSVGGNVGRCSGIADPTATLCHYPAPGETVRIEHRWELSTSQENLPLVSITHSHGELWAVGESGDVHVFLDDAADVASTQIPRSLGKLSLHNELTRVAYPPANRGSWWFFLGEGDKACFVFRSPRIQMTQWPVTPVDIGHEWVWRGAPFAIDRPDGPPAFGAVAEADGVPTLHIFTVPEEPGGDFRPEVVRLPLTDAINVPVQVPFEYADTAETGRAYLRGSLFWVDSRASVHRIPTEGPASSWRTMLWATSRGRRVGGASPSAPPVPLTSPSLPPLPVAGLPPLPVAGLPPLPPLPPLPGAVAPDDATDIPLLQPNFDDGLCVTVEPFAPPHGAAGIGGVRLWSIQRQEHGRREVAVRHLGLEGTSNAEQGWMDLAPNGAFASARKVQEGGEGRMSVFTFSAPPVFVPAPATEPGRRAGKFGQVVAVASHDSVDVLDRSALGSGTLRVPSEARQHEDRVACAPIVTPYGIIAIWAARIEVWTFDVQGNCHNDYLPGTWSQRRAVERGLEPPFLPVRTGSRSNLPRLYPAVIGNRIWIPSDEGKIFCLDLLPESMLESE